jgi:ABC-type Fe3+/spermidine/putrescine transport system ATPase subunit
MSRTTVFARQEEGGPIARPGGPPSAPAAERIRLDDVTVYYGEARALDRFSLTVGRGELVTLLGPSGCGKTTALRVVAGFVHPSGGRVHLRGEPAETMMPHRRNIGLVYQHYALFPHMTVAENIAFGLKVRRWSGARVRAKIEEMLDLVKLPAWGGRYPRELSGGMQQRVAVARALAIEPDILLFDEPLSALDARLRVELREEIKRLHRRIPDVAILYVTHDQEEALVISDRIAVMNAGRIAQIGTPEEIFARPRTVFCATFMGAANILESPVIEHRGDAAIVTIGCQLVEIPVSAACPPGRAVTFCVRPERLRFGGSGHNRVRGTVEDVSFKGAAVTVRVAVITGDTPVHLAAEAPLDQWDGRTHGPAGLPSAGEAVEVSFDRNDCVIVEP